MKELLDEEAMLAGYHGIHIWLFHEGKVCIDMPQTLEWFKNDIMTKIAEFYKRRQGESFQKLEKTLRSKKSLMSL